MQIIKKLLGEEKYYKLKHSISLKPRKKWLKSIYRDLVKNKTVSLKDKLWAYRRGFVSYRIAQFDLTCKNVNRFMSDYDYIKLYPLNNEFVFWINDKLTMRYILSKFSEFMPEYYFHMTKRSLTGVLKLMDCPEEYSADVKGVMDLLKARGVIAVKPVSGTHGNGFYKLTYQDSIYCINGQIADEKMLWLLLGAMRDQIITEYVEMHDELKKMNSNSVNTIRLMVTNENGSDPFIGFAYLRVGTKRSGMVDNISSGGLSCTIDLNSGHYCDAFSITGNNVIVSYKNHPDTKQELEGYIPHWQLISENILRVCRYIPQIEYMGFDIAVTPNGFKIIEINSHLELPLYDFYSEEVRSYFSRLLRKKGIKSQNNF